MALSNEEVDRIASAVVEKAGEDVGVRDVIIGEAMGKGAIPLYGRETRKEPCACCLIDPDEPNKPPNRMCTTKSAIGILNDSEEREWCSEINIVADGRCARARSIREAARECKEKYPEDTTKFFECYAPAFSKITKGSNPGAKDPWQMTLEEYVKSAREWRAENMPRLIGRALEDELEHVAEGHKLIVLNALGAGKSVPPEVLADYPDLGSNPGYAYPRSAIPEPYQREVRRELRKIPIWKLQEAYGKLKGGESTGVEFMERNRAYALSAIEEILWERGKLKEARIHE